MSSARATLVGVLLSAALAVALAARQPDLRPIMPEVDGVHPARALVALHDAFAPGVGFLDKYPPLGSFVFGLAAAAGEVKGLSAQATSIVTSPPEVRRVQLWSVRDEVQGALERERWLSRLAMGAAAALVFLLSQRLAGSPGTAGVLALAGPLLAACAFAASGATRVYAGTANVDALALVPALAALLLLLQSRWAAAGAALALAVALKDPHVVLVPVVLAGAAWLGGRRALLRAAVGAAAVYAAASGALTAPMTWWEHVRYLTVGGVEGVDRLDHADLAGWGRLLGYAGWLLLEGRGVTTILLLAVALPLAGWPAGGRRAGLLIIAAALSPVALFVLPIGFVYARFLLVTQALVLAWIGAAGARFIERGADARERRPRLLPAAYTVMLAALLATRLLPRPGPDPAGDPRLAVPGLLEAAAPQGGRVLLFADEREHGPALDPALWQLEARGLGEVGGALGALRGMPAEARPEWVLVMSFDTERPSGAPRAEEAPAQRGDSVGGLYTVRDVLGEAPARWQWTERAIAVQPRITVLQRAD
ncbi:MAG TPA: hypothetical protein VFY71_08860 [Planctomycetota bacterium]|nr:hypothetical protein [Planctomycetota bacterium]